MNVSPSYLDQRRSPGSVTVQMEEKYQPPSATSLYESRFQRRPPVKSRSFSRVSFLFLPLVVSVLESVSTSFQAVAKIPRQGILRKNQS